MLLISQGKKAQEAFTKETQLGFFQQQVMHGFVKTCIKMQENKDISITLYNPIFLFLAVATCTIADFITLPFMTAQSRLIFQNSSPHFRTYSTFLSVWRKTKISLLFSGASVLLFKNILFNLSWVKLIPESPAYSFIISSIACHFITYPFITVIRQLQVSQSNVPMMKNQSQTVRQCVRRIWNEGGVRQFYRGFTAYGIIHLFMGALMVQANLRSGYFYES